MKSNFALILNSVFLLSAFFGASAFAAAVDQPSCGLPAIDLSGNYLHSEETGGEAQVRLTRISTTAETATYRAMIKNLPGAANTPDGQVTLKISERHGSFDDNFCAFEVFDASGKQLSWGTQTPDNQQQLEGAYVFGPGSDGQLTIVVPGFTCGGEGSSHPCIAESTLYRK